MAPNVTHTGKKVQLDGGGKRGRKRRNVGEPKSLEDEARFELGRFADTERRKGSEESEEEEERHTRNANSQRRKKEPKETHEDEKLTKNRRGSRGRKEQKAASEEEEEETHETGSKRQRGSYRQKEEQVASEDETNEEIPYEEAEPTEESFKEGAIHEAGHAYWFYRPKVGMDEVHSLSDVQKMYLVLVPQIGTLKATHKIRIIALPKKRMPSVTQHERDPGFVTAVGDDIKMIAKDLAGIEYETKTQGSRSVGASRPIGQAHYALVTHHGTGHLVYRLELPEDGPNEVQKLFGIRERVASFVVQVANPQQRGMDRSRKGVTYPEDVQSIFRGRRWASIDRPELLNEVGAHLLFIGGSGGQRMDECGRKVIQGKEEPEFDPENLFRTLRLPKREFSMAPLESDELV